MWKRHHFFVQRPKNLKISGMRLNRDWIDVTDWVHWINVKDWIDWTDWIDWNYWFNWINKIDWLDRLNLVKQRNILKRMKLHIIINRLNQLNILNILNRLKRLNRLNRLKRLNRRNTLKTLNIMNRLNRQALAKPVGLLFICGSPLHLKKPNTRQNLHSPTSTRQLGLGARSWIPSWPVQGAEQYSVLQCNIVHLTLVGIITVQCSEKGGGSG